MQATIKFTVTLPGDRASLLAAFLFFQQQRVIVTGRRHGMGDYECTKDWTELLAYVEWGGCGGHSSVVDRKPLRIPPCPASALLGCNIIKVEYFLEVCMF